MKKVIPVLLAGLLSVGVMAQTSTAAGALAGSGSDSRSASGSVSGSTNNNTSSATSNNANLNNNTNTNTNSVNVYGPGSNRLARQQGATSSQPSAGVSMMPGGDTAPRDARTAQNRACPPGLAKKDNDCLPPGQAKKDDARAMGSSGSTAGQQRQHTTR